MTVRTTVRNLSTRPFPAGATYGRRLVRVGAQLCARDGSLVNRDYERAFKRTGKKHREYKIVRPRAKAQPGTY